MSDKEPSGAPALRALIAGKPQTVEPTVDLKQKLAELVDAKQLSLMLKSLEQQETTNPLESLSKMGFDIKSLASVQKDLSETYRNILQEERAAREKASEKAEKSEELALAAQLKVMDLLTQQTVNELRKSLEDLKEAVASKKPEKDEDEITSVTKKLMAQLLQEAIISKKEEKNPAQQILEQAKYLEQIRELLGMKPDEFDQMRQRGTFQEALQVKRIEKEYELKRWETEQRLKAEQEHRETMMKIVDSVKDFAAALVQSLQANRSVAPPPQVPPQDIATEN